MDVISDHYADNDFVIKNIKTPCLLLGAGMNQPVIHIYAPSATEKRIIRIFCPNCKRKSYFISFFYDWYGWFQTCLRCGDQWSGGEMLERPFMPKWRKINIEEAKKHWEDDLRMRIRR